MPYTQEATIRTHYRRLKKFIRLVDYLILDSKLSLMNNSVTKTVDYLDGNLELLNQKVKSGGQLPTVINIRASFENNSVNYNPSLNYLQKIFDDVIIYGV